jgi:hypothetical protein
MFSLQALLKQLFALTTEYFLLWWVPAYQTTQCCKPEYKNMNPHYHENLKMSVDLPLLS